ncbi:MAG: hypothetical protein JF593_14280 [Novosphingobium sp.]|nr:hypothetical protein [Novosphingobium sp.]
MSVGDVFALIAVICGVVAIVALIGESYKRHLAFKQRNIEILASQTAEKAAQYATHSERLEARVRVLERIATDKGADLAAQIDQLRKVN